METVRLRLGRERRHERPPEDEFAMPEICCVCNAPAERRSLRVYGSSWLSNRLLVMRFPLCETCDGAYTLLSRRRRLGCGIAGGLALLLGFAWAVAAVAGGLGGSEVGSRLSLWFLGLSLAVLVIGIVLYALMPFFAASPEIRARYRWVKRSVQIPNFTPGGILGQGSIVIRFASLPFAEEFRRLNRGALLEEKRG